MWPILLLLSLGVVMGLPFLPAVREWLQQRDAAPLIINPNHDGDIRYFAKTFRSLVDRRGAASQNADKNHAVANVQIFKSGKTFRNRLQDSAAIQALPPIIATQPIDLPASYHLPCEVYSKDSVRSGRYNYFRAVLSDQDLVLRSHSVVTRWAHGNKILIGPKSLILGRLSADKRIVIDPSCVFTRLSAPLIQFARRTPASVRPRSLRKAHRKRNLRRLYPTLVKDGRWFITQNTRIPSNSRLDVDVIAYGDLVIGEGCHLTGSVKTYGRLLLESDIQVNGQLVSERSIAVGRRCTIKGPVVAERSIYLKADTTLGSGDSLTSITALRVRVSAGVRIHGSVWVRGAPFSALQAKR